MQKLVRIIRVGIFYGLTLLLVAGYPMTAVLADTSPYTYNSDTNRWDTAKWQYDPASGQYIPKVLPVQGPVPGEIIGPTDPAPGSAQDVPASESTQPAPAQSSTQSGASTADTNAQVQNNLDSAATTGNATIGSNTSGGNATTGNAAVAATIVNTVQSTVSGDTSGVAHFTADIHGNVTGDITLSPVIDGIGSSGGAGDGSLHVNDTATLLNNLGLQATSGDATVTNNTTAGNATTGTADAVLNLINLINSIIAANKSFVGTINIYGNLNGDILVSPEFIPQLLASNNGSANGSVDATLTDNQSIINNIQLNAASGSATVAGNTAAGTAKTGSAQTNLTVLNLSGHAVVAKNSLLIFVNVLGTWVGVIVDAPVGATAAALGNGVVTNSVSDQKIDATNDSTITNNISVGANSGNANVSGNTTAGNATSGNATASANIANVSNSSFGLSDWFGVLFINVFGSWHGSFGINTSQGDIAPMYVPTSSSAAAGSGGAPPIIFGFVPRAPSSPTPSYVPPSAMTDQSVPAAIEDVSDPSIVLASELLPAKLGPVQTSVALNPGLVAMMVVGFIGAVTTAIYGLSSRRR